MNRSKSIYSIILLLIFLGSFFLYSSLFYPLLNSDNAVTILMIYYFKLPGDLYFWGQDRLGSLIPLIGQIPHKLFSISPLVSESIVHYGILLAGFLAFSTFIRSSLYKIIFAVIWFFPPMRLIDVTQFAFGIHYSLIAIVCYLLKIILSKNDLKPVQYYSLLTLITLLLITAVWVSDMAIVSAGLITAFLITYLTKENTTTNIRHRNNFFIFSVVGTIAGYLFIHYAKSLTTIQNTYSAFGDAQMIRTSATVFIKSLSDFFTFSSDEPLTNIYAYLVLALIISIIIFIRKLNLTSQLRMWLYYFLIESVILLCLILISKWTFINNVPRRYFTCTYITLSIAVIIILDNLYVSYSRKLFLQILTTIAVITGGASTIYNIKNFAPSGLIPMTTVLNDFKKLGKIGVISEYWNSYVTSCIDPENIKATPHDQTYAVRNSKIVDEVFEQPEIYIIRDMWMDNFPDSMRQFNRPLIRSGKEFKMGDCFVCRYSIIQ